MIFEFGVDGMSVLGRANQKLVNLFDVVIGKSRYRQQRILRGNFKHLNRRRKILSQGKSPNLHEQIDVSAQIRRRQKYFHETARRLGNFVGVQKTGDLLKHTARVGEAFVEGKVFVAIKIVDEPKQIFVAVVLVNDFGDAAVAAKNFVAANLVVLNHTAGVNFAAFDVKLKNIFDGDAPVVHQPIRNGLVEDVGGLVLKDVPQFTAKNFHLAT